MKGTVLWTALLVSTPILSGGGLLAFSVVRANEAAVAGRVPGAQTQEPRNKPARGEGTQPEEGAKGTDAEDALLGRWVVESITSGLDGPHWLSAIAELSAVKPSMFHSVKLPASLLIDVQDGRTLTLEYRLRVSNVPREIDLILDPHGKAETYRGIYAIVGATLKICASLPKEIRPAELTAAAGSKRVLLTLRRPEAKVGRRHGHREASARGVDWLAGRQQADGSWQETHGKHAVALTSAAATALWTEGSTYREGRHGDRIKRATDWLLAQRRTAEPHAGLIGVPGSASLFDHAFAVAYLSKVYGDIADAREREPVKTALALAIRYLADAQAADGGWFETARADGHDKADPVLTVLVLDGLREARNAGLPVPKETRARGRGYLTKVLEDGSVSRTGPLARDPVADRPLVTAGSLWLAIAAEEQGASQTKKWLKFCRSAIPPGGPPRVGKDELLHYYFARVVHRLGDEGWNRLFPEAGGADRLTWTAYRQARFDFLQRTQESDGSWKDPESELGPVYATALHLTVLHLENAPLPLSR